jgi:hypothetical protein
MFASARDFPKFVTVAAAMEHELRKVGTRPRRKILGIVAILRGMIRSKQIVVLRQSKSVKTKWSGPRPVVRETLFSFNELG